jgi:hypothetical protein
MFVSKAGGYPSGASDSASLKMSMTIPQNLVPRKKRSNKVKKEGEQTSPSEVNVIKPFSL